ncbi:uncharacterized protein [Procambarus clarkii]|uniref:uncharacterized protein n=1 Tax=Procambarus clarkii TaxID=6728 RepID=UPI0037431D40
MIETVKKCLRKTLHRQKIRFPELQTLIVEIEVRVNNCPLTYLSDDFSQREPLSPSHLIHGGLLSPLIPLAEEDPVDPSHVTRRDLVESYQHLSRVIKRWNEVWTREYHYGASNPYNRVQLKPGDLVLIDSDGPRSEWPIGKIVSIHPDHRDILRVVRLLCRGTTTLKTLEKLVPLELAERECSTKPTSPIASEDNNSDPPSTRPLRTAAQQCKRKLQTYYSSD